MSLRGLRVVDRASGAAGRRLGALLADQGATVIALRDDGGDPLWDRAKRVVSRAGTEGADVLIDDDPRASDVHGLVHVRVPAFPPDHRHHDVDDAGAAEAMAGLHRPLFAPRVPPVDVAGPIAALLGACGVVAASLLPEPQSVLISQLDAGLLAQELAALFAHRPPSAWTTLQWAASPFIAPYAASDGFVYVHVGLAHHLTAFLRQLRVVGCDRSADALRRAVSDATLRDPTSVATPGEARELRRLLAELFVARPALLWEEQLGGAGLCVVAHRTGGAWRDGPAVEGGQVVDVSDPLLGVVRQPAPLVRLPSTPKVQGRRLNTKAPRWAARATADVATGRLALEGVRVLDLSQVIAGPTCGRTLAWFGADVLHIEHPHLNAPWVDAFHTLFQAGKRSAFLDLASSGGRDALHQLIERWRPQVVVHNLAAGADERLGLQGDGRVVVAVSAWGRSGPRASWRGWEQTIQAACGVQLDYGSDGAPELMPVPVHDLATGLAAAFGVLCALREGKGGGVEASLSQTSMWLQEHLFRGAGRAPMGRRGGKSRSDGAWRKEGRAWVYYGLVRVPGGRLADALSERKGLWRRVSSAVGEVTEVGCPLRMSGTPCVERSAPVRGAHGDVVGTEAPPAPSSPGRVVWLLRQVAWATVLAKPT